MMRRIVYGLADALDRVGATLIALSIMGAWFTDQINPPAGVFGLLAGIVTVLLGVYTKEVVKEASQ